MNTVALNTWTAVAAAIRTAADDNRIILTTHARERMAERSIDMEDISHALRTGHAEPQFEGRLSFASKHGEIIVSFSSRELSALVITVMTPPSKRPLEHTARQRRKPRTHVDDKYVSRHTQTILSGHHTMTTFDFYALVVCLIFSFGLFKLLMIPLNLIDKYVPDRPMFKRKERV
jgi:hypothetical protein